MFHAEIAHEEHTYDLGSVIESITAKLIRRHPHVFGSVTVRDSNDVLHNWSKIKAAEHQGQHSPFSGLPRSLPALTLAEAIWQRAAGLGFHPPDTATALARVQTELQALSAATTPTLQRETLGNLLVAIIAVSNAMRIDAEDALRQAAQQLASHLSQYIQSQTSTPSGAREEAPRLLDIWSAPTRPTVSPIKHG
jgi:tetrapyrrole methylase family protein/MazG family protein